MQNAATKRAAAVAAVLAIGLAAGVAEAKDKIKVGFIGPLSGGTSSNGLGGRNSADLAVRLKNADADAKYEYELVVLDDECKPDKGVQVATKLAADKNVIAAATHYCSAVAIATVDVYNRFGLPIIVWGAVLPDITYGNDYKEVHRVNGTMINQNETAAKFMTGLGYKTWAIIHDTTDYGKGHNKYFSQYLTENGGKILGTFGVTADQQDFTAELTKIKSLDPDVLYFGGLTPLGVRVRSQMEKLGLRALFEGTSGIVSDTFIEGSGELAEGVLAFREGAPTELLPGGKVFMEQYKKQNYAEPSEAYGPFAFAAMNLILDTIEAVGPDRKKVRDTLNATKGRDSIVGEISFDKNGQNSVALITKYVAQDGKWTVWAESEYAKGKRKLKGQK
ncbi:MAG: branched-chain amino acid ABC transporter substrate-binding protein [Alphaproteobacteria bacterium]|nr:branched-chain amino acid ABC transporter substrate-binding protein [Alphaproteobacteria bacterium]